METYNTLALDESRYVRLAGGVRLDPGVGTTGGCHASAIIGVISGSLTFMGVGVVRGRQKGMLPGRCGGT